VHTKFITVPGNEIRSNVDDIEQLLAFMLSMSESGSNATVPQCSIKICVVCY
jgi:hypothetical protein